MLNRSGKAEDAVDDEEMATLFRKHLHHVKTWLDEQPDFDVIYVSYNDMMENPLPELQRIDQFIGGMLDTKQMAEVIDPSLYRQRKQQRYGGDRNWQRRAQLRDRSAWGAMPNPARVRLPPNSRGQPLFFSSVSDDLFALQCRAFSSVL